MSFLICFSGQIGSGKSSISLAVAQALGWPRVSFGDYLRAELARRGGDPTSREALQDLGQQLVESDPEGFCLAVLQSGGVTSGRDAVVDGIRHVRIYHTLVQMRAPSGVRLVHLEASETVRTERVSTRYDHDDLARASSHAVEAEVRDSLPRQADLVLNAEAPMNVVVASCLDAIAAWH